MRDYLDTIQDKLVDVKTALADADEENRALLRQVDELKRMASVGKDFQIAEGVYWRENVPYCPVCWDVDRKTVRLSGPAGRVTGFSNVFGWECCFHKALFGFSQERSIDALK
ncbi:MAG: hypothetical protein LAP87_26680 [Acidobacteriia bacterium]|nr:hypothetical protein [Terriglobia bacterium]